jgi:uncharacterized protein (TIGR00255 family)
LPGRQSSAADEPGLSPMTLSSMTGFARVDGTCGAYAWSWELRSLNAKGFDLRLRLPPSWEAMDAPIRARAGEKLARGALHANLSVRREGLAPVVQVNQAVLDAVLATMKQLAAKVQAAPPTLDGILALKGIVEVIEPDEREEDRRAAETAIRAGFEMALAALMEMRRHEGQALGAVLELRLHEIAALAERAEAAPGRQPDAIKARLAEQVAILLDASDRLDPDRLHQEAVLAATKADVREELDRLAAHINHSRQLIAAGGPVGRRLDFLAQELNREANTLCAKSNDVELTGIGLALKAVVEQFREQVQNLE